MLNLGDPAGRSQVLVDVIAATARARGLVSRTIYAGTAQQIERAFASARQLRVAGVNALGSPFPHGINRGTARTLGLPLPRSLLLASRRGD